MKNLLLASALCLSFGAMAQSVEEANQLFDARGTSAVNALKAADMFKKLADATTEKSEKGVLKYRESQSLYFYGGRITNKEERKSIYTRGVDSGEEAIKQLSESGKAAKSDLALANYFMAINLGKWGQVNGIFNSLAKLPKMLRTLDTVDSLDESVEEYGAARSRGRVYHLAPSIATGHNEDDALNELSNAYDNTLVDVTVGDETFQTSSNATTTVYLLDILAKMERKTQFCDVLMPIKALIGASDEVLATVNATKVPEFKNDLENLKKCLDDANKCDDADFNTGKKVNAYAKQCK